VGTGEDVRGQVRVVRKNKFMAASSPESDEGGLRIVGDDVRSL
jgi:hypothetical protein